MVGRPDISTPALCLLLFDTKCFLAVSGLDNSYQTVLSSWASQDEVESESSNEEEDASGQPEGAVNT